MVIRTRIFKTNRSQAVRLPKALAFPEDVADVEIMKIGNSLLITPAGKNWVDYFENGPFVTDDFMPERDRWDFEEREPF